MKAQLETNSNILPKYFKIKNFPYKDKIEHFFFTRNLDIKDHQFTLRNHDDLEERNLILNNREKILSFFKINSSEICFPNQYHSNDVIIANSGFSVDKKYEADAVITSRRNLILAVRTADCVPLLFADSTNNIIGAVHAGSKGARSGIIENSVRSLLEIGSNNENLIALIGPSIRQDSYEIGEDFYNDFISECRKNTIFFKKSTKNGKYLFDLPAYIIDKLEKLNIKYMDIKLDTLSSEDIFFSYRRDHLKPNYSRENLVSAIMIRDKSEK